MNTVTKLTQKDVVKSIFTFLFGIVGIYLIMLCMIAVTRGVHGFSAYFVEYKNELVTIGVSIPILFAILYTFFFFENKGVLTSASKICELFLIIYIALAVTFVFSKYVDPMSRPFVFVSLMCVTLFRRRDAIFINTTYALLMLIIDRFAGLTMQSDMIYRSYACLLCTFCTGIIAAFVFSSMKNRFQCVIFAFILFVPVEIINCVIVLPVAQFPAKLVLDLLIFGAVGCLVSVMLYMFILPLFEKLFAEMTVFRLREITSDSKFLLNEIKGKTKHSDQQTLALGVAMKCTTVLHATEKRRGG